nr:unnamed protein product [Callosobruchus chinensis]
MMFYYITFLTFILSISIYAQDIPGYIEVTSEKDDGGIGRIARCGENGERKMCVKYYECDPNTKTISRSSSTNGFGVIDIRFGANECSETLEVCCNLPDEENLDPSPKNPDTPAPPPPPTPRPKQPTGCGQRNADGIDFRIAGAENGEAEYGEFPWMVAIMKGRSRKMGGPAVRRLIAQRQGGANGSTLRTQWFDPKSEVYQSSSRRMGHPVSVREVATSRKRRKLNHSPRRFQSNDCLQRHSVTDTEVSNKTGTTYRNDLSACARPRNRI